MPDNKRELTADKENENSKRQKVDSNNNNSEGYINNLPTEILHKIGGFFEIGERRNLASTNKKFKEIVNDLDEKELSIVLPKLGFAGKKDNKPTTFIEAKEIYKRLKILEKKTMEFTNLFYSQNITTPKDDIDKKLKIYLDDLYSSSKDFASIKLNWANIFDNAININLKIKNNLNHSIEDIINDSEKYDSPNNNATFFLSSLIHGNNSFNLTLLQIVAMSFNDSDCKDVLQLLFEKYKGDPDDYDSIDYTNNSVLDEVTNRNLIKSIAYIQNLIQQQEKQSNVKNHP